MNNIAALFAFTVSSFCLHQDSNKSTDRVMFPVGNYDGKTRVCTLMIQDLDGNLIKKADIPSMIDKMRPTCKGTAVGVGGFGKDKKIYEIDRDGNVVWQLNSTTDTVCPLENDNLLIAAGSIIREVDRNGKVIRELKVELKEKTKIIDTIWSLGKDRILVGGWTVIYELDWDGKKHFEHQVEKGSHIYDIAPLPSGNLVVSLNTTDIDKRPKAGKVMEIDRSGKVVWSFSADCPWRLQALSNGNVLVGGG